jgi:hypothetical protein
MRMKWSFSLFGEFQSIFKVKNLPFNKCGVCMLQLSKYRVASLLQLFIMEPSI